MAVTYKRTDLNQQSIVNALRQIGAHVVDTSEVGHGFPDLVVGWRGQTYLIECKNGDRAPSARKLTSDQQIFLLNWAGGPLFVVDSPSQAIAMITQRETA